MPPVRFAYKYGYAKADPLLWLKSLEQGTRLSLRYFQSFYPTVIRGNIHMGDQINVGAAHVVMGTNAKAGDITTSGAVSIQHFSQTDLAQIAEELALLRKSLRKENSADEVDRDSDIGAVATAEKAARAGDATTMLQHLKMVGAWVFDVATKIGVNLATAALKQAADLKG
jgi:hypothetical protein